MTYVWYYMCTVFDWFCLITCSWLQSSSIIKLWYLDVMSWDSCTLQCIHLGEGRQQDTRYGSSNDCSTAGVTTQRVINFCLSLYYNWGGRVKAGSKQVSSKQNEMVGSFHGPTPVYSTGSERDKHKHLNTTQVVDQNHYSFKILYSCNLSD